MKIMTESPARLTNGEVMVTSLATDGGGVRAGVGKKSILIKLF